MQCWEYFPWIPGDFSRFFFKLFYSHVPHEQIQKDSYNIIIIVIISQNQYTTLINGGTYYYPFVLMLIRPTGLILVEILVEAIVSWTWKILKLSSKSEDHIFIWFQTPHFI